MRQIAATAGICHYAAVVARIVQGGIIWAVVLRVSLISRALSAVEDAVVGFWRTSGVSGITTLVEYLNLKSQKIGLDRGRATDTPKQRGQSQHQLAFHGRLGVVVGDDGRFKSLVVF